MIMAMPIIRHNIANAFFCDLFFMLSLIKIGTTNQMTKPIMIGTILIILKDIDEEALFENSASPPIRY